MAGKGRPVGSKGTKAKMFGDALRMTAMELADEKRADKTVRAETNLRRAADALMLKAMTGDVPAIKEVADRLDGKVPQAVIGGGEESAHVHELVFRLVRPR